MKKKRKPKTAIESINDALNDIRCLKAIYQLVCKNIYARQYGWRPTMRQIVQYLEWMKCGFVYAESRLGKVAIASNFKLASQAPPQPGYGPLFAGYVIEWDTVVICIARLAKDAQVNSWDTLVHHEGIAEKIPAWLSPMLIAIEESFHRYQLKVLKRPIPEKSIAGLLSGHPLETEAKEFVENAMRDLLAHKPAQAP